MKKFNRLLIMILLMVSCTKQEFSTNKSSQSSAISAAQRSCSTLYTQSTLIKPKVDILILWDKTSSYNFVTAETKAAMDSLISTVSSGFDYHILNAPLVPASSTSLYDMSLIASDPTTVSGNATTILKDAASAKVALSSMGSGPGGSEAGIDRAYDVITSNMSNGIFRTGAYTLIVVISNEDDKGCELGTPYSLCPRALQNSYLDSKKSKFLCLRGSPSCSGSPTLNSSMMRFITVAPTTSCSSGFYNINYLYKTMSTSMYGTNYVTSSGTWKPNDDLSSEPDVNDLCSITNNMSSIFSKVNTAIKEQLIKHVYNYWPLASSTASVDPDTIYVSKSDGTALTYNACVVAGNCSSTPTSGFGYIGVQSNHATRVYPTTGEYFSGKMIQLYGNYDSATGAITSGDLVGYPQSLTVCYQEIKDKYGYIYLTNGEPYTPSIEVTINGSVVPQSTTNGWSYMGLQYMSALDSSLKVAKLPAGTTSGYIIKLNGTYQVTNSSNISISVLYTSKSN